MKLAVSNIAWLNEEEVEIAQLLRDLGVRYIEIAPTKLWGDPTKASHHDIENYIAFWKSYDIEIIAFQSMLFGRPDLKIFENLKNRQATLDYLKDFISLAGQMGAGVMVFGSPKNRQREKLALLEADAIAIEFFNELGIVASRNNVQFCIEPNAPQYACDFVTNAQEGIDIVRKVSNPGFGLHLDIACMTLAGDDITKSIVEAAQFLEHFHISSPMLELVDKRSDVRHGEAAKALAGIGYQGYVSIEMRPGELGANLERVRTAVEFSKSVYGND